MKQKKREYKEKKEKKKKYGEVLLYICVYFVAKHKILINVDIYIY